MFALFVIVLAAAEAAIGLAIVLAIFQTFRSIDVQRNRFAARVTHRHGTHTNAIAHAMPRRLALADPALPAARRRR